MGRPQMSWSKTPSLGSRNCWHRRCCHTPQEGRSRRTLALTVTFRTSYDCEAGRQEQCLPSSSLLLLLSTELSKGSTISKATCTTAPSRLLLSLIAHLSCLCWSACKLQNNVS
ncbi:hypothetical protein BT69DRAFT_75218 [Atractiella rhizophila]|nr:hypothetical protein BT69DRAFT_75218 [Atractiella rhizophila]